MLVFFALELNCKFKFPDDIVKRGASLDGMKRLFMSKQAEVAKAGLCMQKTKLLEIGTNAIDAGRCLIDGEKYASIDDLSILEIQYLQMASLIRK